MKNLLIAVALMTTFSATAATKDVSIYLESVSEGCMINVVNNKNGESGKQFTKMDCSLLALMMVKKARNPESIEINLNGKEVKL